METLSPGARARAACAPLPHSASRGPRGHWAPAASRVRSPPPAPRPREGDELLLPVSCRRRTQAPRGRASVPASLGPKAGQLPRRLRPAPRGTGVAGAGRKHSLVSQVPVEWRLAPGGVPGTRGTVWGPWWRDVPSSVGGAQRRCHLGGAGEGPGRRARVRRL